MQVLELSPHGKKLRTERDAVDLIAEAAENKATIVMIPVERLDDDFFRLRTRIAGEFIQKFVTYGVRLAIVGDISRHIDESTAFRDFVHEANRGQHVWFMSSRDELEQRAGL